jgi:hypothetical protein
MGIESDDMETEDKRKVVVDRSKWRFGGDIKNVKYGWTMLLNERGFKCCLGFAIQQLEGVPEHEMLNLKDPADLNKRMKDLTILIGPESIVNSGLSNELMMLNDNRRLTHQEREEKIYEAGKEHGILFEFVGEYPELRNKES